MNHFASLIFEYSLLPILLFGFVFISKREKVREKSKSLPGINEKFTNELSSDGYEFLLIEICTHFSVFLRIYFDEHTCVNSLNYILAFISALISAILFVIFIICRVRYQSFFIKNLLPFNMTFYGSFFSWWLRVIILGIYSSFFLWHTYILIFVSLIFILSIFIFRKIIFLNFIKWNILFIHLNYYNESRYYSKAQKIGWYIINQVSGKEGENNIIAFSDVIAELGMSYYLENKPHKWKIKKVITLLRNFVNAPQNSNFVRIRHKMILIGLYCMTGQKVEAKKIINTLDSEKEKKQIQKLVDNNMCNQIVIVNV